MLVAADSITNTMSSLVKELNSGESLVPPPSLQQDAEVLSASLGDLSADCQMLKIFFKDLCRHLLE